MMDRIEAFGIDDAGSLWIKPASANFPHIYREAMGVGWDEKQRRLTGQTPRDWSYVDWFNQIRRAARRQGVELMLDSATTSSNIPEDLRRQIANSAG